MGDTIRVQAPGKLFIAGEYAVVDPTRAAILVAVDRYLTVELRPTPRAETLTITSDAYPEPKTWTATQDPTDYLTSAINVVESVARTQARTPQTYSLTITSQLQQGGHKLGLGSSGAVTVAVVEAVGRLYRLGLTRLEIYRLAMLATIAIAPQASGGDVAASTFGGWIRYTSPDRGLLRQALTSHGPAHVFADESSWAGNHITHLPPPPLPLLVGWTATPADTTTLVARASTTRVEGFYEASDDVVAHLAQALHQGNTARLVQAITRARSLLAEYASATGIVIETPHLAALSDIAHAHGGAGKSSGAGGGDCGIAFASPQDAAAILEEWTHQGITPLAVHPHPPKGDHP